MSGRRKQDYKGVLRAITRLMIEQPFVQEVTIDFESAIWGAFKRVMPHVKLSGCCFHWTQAVWRHIQQSGLQRQYMQVGNTLYM